MAGTSTMLVSNEGKRWTVVGITLYKVVAPVLRTFVKQEITNLYTHYESNCNLKTLTPAQASAHPELRLLTFRNINSNHLQSKKHNYNYNINNEVDLAKLHLPVYLAKHISDFDESLEISVILGLLGDNAPSILVPPSPRIQTAAIDVRDNVRNKWGHFNPNEWTDTFFDNCFDKLEVLVKCLGLPDGGKTTLDQLADWKTKGCHLCMGHVVDQNLLQFVQQDMNALVEEFKNIKDEIEEQHCTKKARLEFHDECLKRIEENQEILKNLYYFQKNLTEELLTRLKQVEQKLSSEEISGAGKSSGIKGYASSSRSSSQDQTESDGPSTSGIFDGESLSTDTCTSMPQMYNNMNFEPSINPPDSELEGGKPFVLKYKAKLPEEIHSGWALFEKTTYVEVKKWNENCFSGLEIPPGTKPGFAPVEVLTQDKAFSLGSTRILYLSKDERKKIYQQLVHDKGRQCEFFYEWAASRRDVGGNMSGSSQISSSLGLCNQEGSSQPADVHELQTLVETAAETDAYEFLHMIFNTSAGRVAFEAYNNVSPLPEDIARVNGHERTAQYLGEVFQRFSMEERKGEEQAHEVDWAELERAVKVSQQELVSPNEGGKVQFHGDALFDKFGGLEAPSAEFTVRHWLENQNTENIGAVSKEQEDLGEILSVTSEDQCLVESCDSSEEKGLFGCHPIASAPLPAASTKETTNFVRLCHLLVEVGCQALKDTFDGIHPPAGLHLVLACNPEHMTLYSLREKKILKPTQWRKLYPADPSSVSSAKFDVTLLMILLKHICHLNPPITGWDRLPPVTDVSVAANIARVKYYRNTLYSHASQASVDDATFNRYWEDISNTLVALGGASYEAAIKRLKNECMDPGMEGHYRELLKQWKKDDDSINMASVASTKGTTNYARLCRLLVNVGSQALRDTFDGMHPPAGLHLVLARHPEHAMLQSLRERRILNPTQWRKLYPTTPAAVSSASFDVTLLIVLLRNICGLHSPATGWDSLPPAADTSKEANIARVKYYRNAVYCHASQASVDDATFNTYWQDISNTLVALGGASYGTTINKLKSECIDPDMEEHYRELLKQWKEDEDSIKDVFEEKEGADSDDIPPLLSFEVPKLRDLPNTSIAWNHVELPIDFLVLTVDDYEFLGCFYYLKRPYKSYCADIGYVFFGSMGNDSKKTLKIALMKCSKGSLVPGGSLTVVKNAIRVLRPKAVFSVGACSGLYCENVKRGDVVVSSKITAAVYKTPTSRDIGTLIRHAADGWNAPLENPDALDVRVHCDCEALSRPEGAVKDVIQRCPEASAVEMESEGIFAAAHYLKTEWVVVRGVKDFAGDHEPSSDEWGRFASVMAASVVANILSDPVVFQEWPNYQGAHSDDIPPLLRDLPNTITWTLLNHLELPIDFLLLTVDDCEFLGCYYYLKRPYKSYCRDIGYVYFGSMDNDSKKTLKIALMKCSKGYEVPDGSLTVVKNAVKVLSPKAVFSVGVCSGLNCENVKRGHVVVSSKITTTVYSTPTSRDIGTLIRHAADGWNAPLENPNALDVRVYCDGDGDVLSRPQEAVEDIIQRFPEARAVEMEGPSPVERFDVKSCRSKLAEHYKRTATVPTSVWSKTSPVDIHQIYTRLSWVKEEQTPYGSSQSELSHYTDVFTANKNGVLPKRILVYGRPGIGKSTFVKKLAVDWAELETRNAEKHKEVLETFEDEEDKRQAEIKTSQDDEDVSSRDDEGMSSKTCKDKPTDTSSDDGHEDMKEEQKSALKKFDIVLVIDLMQVSKCHSLRDVVNLSYIFSEEEKTLTEGLLNYITKNQEKALLVFDGYDKYRCGRNSEVYEIFMGKKLRDCCVLITTRISKSDQLRQFEDAHAEITGFSARDRDMFMRKMFGNENEAQELKGHLSLENLEDLASVPLLLSFFCTLWKKGKFKSFTETKTKLYLMIVQYVLDYNQSKDSPVRFGKVEDFKEILTEIGKVALECLLKGHHVFEYDQLSAAILCEESQLFGLLQVSEYAENLRPTGMVSFVHLSIQEFLAAWYITYRYVPQGNLGEITEHTRTLEDCEALENVFHFVCGLSDDGAVNVFQHLLSVRICDPTLDLSKAIPDEEKETGVPLCDVTGRHQRFTDLVNNSFREVHSKDELVRNWCDCLGGIVLVTKNRSLSELVPKTNYVIQAKHPVSFVFAKDNHDIGCRVVSQLYETMDFLDCLHVPLRVTKSSEVLEVGDFVRKFMNVERCCCFHSILSFRDSQFQLYITDLELRCVDHTRLFTDICNGQYLKFLRSLCCINCLNSQAVEDIGAAIGNCKYLKSIEINGSDDCTTDLLDRVPNPSACHLKITCTLTSAGSLKLAGLLSRFNNVTILNLDLSCCSAAAVDTLLVSIPHKPLEELQLSGVNLTLTGTAALGRLLPKMYFLRRLELTGKDGRMLLTEEMEALFGRFNKTLPLYRLTFSGFSVTGCLAPLVKSFCFFPNLRELCLEEMNLNERDLCSLFKNLRFIPNLEKLSLQGKPLCDPCCCAAELNTVGSFTHTPLKELLLNEISLTPAAAVVLGRSLPEMSSLETLELTGRDGSVLQAEEMKALFGGFNKVLPLLRLTFSGFSVKSCLGPLTNSFPFFPSLRELHLGKINMDKHDLYGLLESLRFVPYLKVLSLVGNPPSHEVASVRHTNTNHPNPEDLSIQQRSCLEEDLRFVRDAAKQIRKVRPELIVFPLWLPYSSTASK